jgi:hypothetical protein
MANATEIVIGAHTFTMPDGVIRRTGYVVTASTYRRTRVVSWHRTFIGAARRARACVQPGESTRIHDVAAGDSVRA